MSNTHPFILMSASQAQSLRDATSGRGDTIDPVLIRGGEYEGQYGIPERVIYAQEFSDIRDIFRDILNVKVLQPSVAFPPEPEPEDDD